MRHPSRQIGVLKFDDGPMGQIEVRELAGEVPVEKHLEAAVFLHQFEPVADSRSETGLRFADIEELRERILDQEMPVDREIRIAGPVSPLLLRRFEHTAGKEIKTAMKKHEKKRVVGFGGRDGHAVVLIHANVAPIAALTNGKRS